MPKRKRCEFSNKLKFSNKNIFKLYKSIEEFCVCESSMPHKNKISNLICEICKKNKVENLCFISMSHYGYLIISPHFKQYIDDNLILWPKSPYNWTELHILKYKYWLLKNNMNCKCKN